jgi:hypothetical protein
MPSLHKPAATLQQVLRLCQQPANHPHVQKVMVQLKKCRTADNGYHLYQCHQKDCGQLKYQYHSCHNRHCPQCGALKKDQWIEARKRELLPVKYYHVVFTLPHQLNSIILGNRKQLFKLLFDASAQTLLSFASDARYLGAKPAIISVLHTWGQQLSFHPHVHCIVSGGGIVSQHNHMHWKQATKNDWQFLFPVKAMNKVFRGKFLQGLKLLLANKQIDAVPADDTKALIGQLYQKEWIVYAKAPFGGPQQVIEYLSRYTHKVAISNHRIQNVDETTGTVTFAYKDYADNGKQKLMTLQAQEFIRRFQQHILPRGFTKIRSYGYLSNRGRNHRMATVLKHLQLPPHPPPVSVPWQLRLLLKYGISHNQCPHCKKQSLRLIAVHHPKKGADDG